MESELKRLQERNSRLVAVEGRAAEKGDTATIDFPAVWTAKSLKAAQARIIRSYSAAILYSGI